MIDITLKCQEKVHSFHHYLIWFWVPMRVLAPSYNHTY
jgi:hypothetical protein